MGFSDDRLHDSDVRAPRRPAVEDDYRIKLFKAGSRSAPLEPRTVLGAERPSVEWELRRLKVDRRLDG